MYDVLVQICLETRSILVLHIEQRGSSSMEMKIFLNRRTHFTNTCSRIEKRERGLKFQILFGTASSNLCAFQVLEKMRLMTIHQQQGELFSSKLTFTVIVQDSRYFSSLSHSLSLFLTCVDLCLRLVLKTSCETDLDTFGPREAIYRKVVPQCSSDSRFDSL